MVIKYGIVSEILPGKGRVRVKFPDVDMVSFPIPVMVTNTKANKFFHSFDVSESVVCLMDERCENGVVLGAIYDSGNLPESGLSNDQTKVTFSDGSVVEFNRANSELIVTTGTTNVKVKPGGVEISKGGESLKSILSDLLSECIIETHPSSGAPPANAAAYTAIKTRINNFFSA